VAHADDEKGIAADLAHYFPISKTLAEDKTDGVKEQAEKLQKSEDKAIAKAAEALAKASDLAGARKAFMDVSKAVLAAVETASKKGEKLPTLYVFECPMAKPYGKWAQDVKEIANPYHGSKMLKCGKLVGTTADGKKEGGHDHGDHDHGEHGHGGKK
jgi:hypothetical protein